MKDVKVTVERTLSLDIKELKDCLANVGSRYIHVWGRESFLGSIEQDQIRIIIHEERIVLSSLDNRKRDYPISITWTKCNYGGKRPWFQCPKCEKRARFLYSKNDIYLCRTCQSLNYKSTQTSAPELYKVTQRMKRIAQKLKIENYKVYEIPDLRKPKGMHWKTFIPLYEELATLYSKRIYVLASMYPM